MVLVDWLQKQNQKSNMYCMYFLLIILVAILWQAWHLYSAERSQSAETTFQHYSAFNVSRLERHWEWDGRMHHVGMVGLVNAIAVTPLICLELEQHRIACSPRGAAALRAMIHCSLSLKCFSSHQHRYTHTHTHWYTHTNTHKHSLFCEAVTAASGHHDQSW